MGDLSGLKGTQSNTLCSGFVDKTLSWGFWKLFPTGTYAIIGTMCVEFEKVMKFYLINKEISLDALNLSFVHFKKLMKYQYLKYEKI